MKYKTEKAWYSSPEHFRSERSWSQYKKSASKRKIQRRLRLDL